MTETIYLMGSEDVRRASSQMQSAAEDMMRAASSIKCSLEQHQWFMDDWLQRFSSAMDKINEK